MLTSNKERILFTVRLNMPSSRRSNSSPSSSIVKPNEHWLIFPNLMFSLSDVRCLIDHNSSYVLGRTVADTLKLEVDDVGLRFRCELPNTSYARDTGVVIN
jgi:hypothetical protein